MTKTGLQWILYHIIPLATMAVLFHWTGFLWLLFADICAYGVQYILNNSPIVSLFSVIALVIVGTIGVFGSISLLVPGSILSFAFAGVYIFLSIIFK